MKSPELFKEYTWLLYTINRAGKITFEQIQEKWKQEGIRNGENLSRSTFNRHKEAVAELLGVNIVCNTKAGYVYSLEDENVLKDNSIKHWLLTTIAINSLISQSMSLSSRILLESIPSGHTFLQTIITAMKNNHAVEIEYRKFGSEEVSVFTVNPCCLKVFHQRWYMLGDFGDDGSGSEHLFVFALDRFVSARETEESFSLSADFNAEAFFNECFGVIAGDGTKAEEIVLRIYGKEVFYIESLPLHSSQKLLDKQKKYADFAYYLRPTQDFKIEILSRGNSVQVLSPEHLRAEIKEILKKSLKLYK